MEPANTQRSVTPLALAAEFLPDAEAIEARPVMRGAPLAVWGMAGLLAAAIAWASLAQIDRVVSARGKLVTTPATMVVQPFETSIIRRIDVRPGQVVRKGESLGALDATFAAADSAQLKARLASLEAQTRRLEAEAAGSPYEASDEPEGKMQRRLYEERAAAHAAQLRRLDESIAQLAAAQATNAHDREVLTRRLGGANQIEKMRAELLASATGSKLKLLESQDQRLAVERDLAQASNRAEEQRRQFAAAQAERAAFAREWTQKTMEELVTVRRERDAVAEQLAKAERKSELVAMTAPADSVVLEVAKRSVGSVVREAEPLFTLVPLDAPLEAEVQIGADDIGVVRLGDPARLKFDAFPFQRHGTVQAELAILSEDAFLREAGDAASKPAEKGSEAFYRGRLNLGQNELRQLGSNPRLLPGMTLTAEIVIGQRSVISYLLYPVMKGLDEALREP